MNDVTSIFVLIAFILGIMLLFNLYSRMLSKISQRGIRRQLEKGKINDQRLTKLCNAADKGRKRKFFAIFMYGIFFKSFLNMQEDIYQLYKAEMDKRGLTNQ